MGRSVFLFRGLPVQDATENITVTVTSRDVRGGYTRLPNYCVVHHALQRELHVKRDDVHVHNTKAYIISDDHTHWVRYNVTGTLLKRVRAHDNGEIFPEGEYILSRPAPTMTLPAMRERNAITKRHHTGERKGKAPHRDKARYNHKE